MLKNLTIVVNHFRGKEYKAKDILLIDDSPKKNLLNDPYNAIHPQTRNGKGNDNFLKWFFSHG